MGDLGAPDVPDGAEHRLLLVPSDPTDLDVALRADGPGGGCGDPAVPQDELEPGGDALDRRVRLGRGR